MSHSDWVKIEFQEFVNKFNIELVIQKAPKILYSKKDKEHVAENSLIAAILIAGLSLIYIAISVILMPIYPINTFIFYPVLSASGMAIGWFTYNYRSSNVYIKPIECWVEIYKGKAQDNMDSYCFTYYPIFSGKCLPNKAKNVIFKLYQEEVLKSKIDITQIEVYIKINQEDHEKYEDIGYFIQYGEGKSFKDENIDRNSWKFFPAEKGQGDNFLATANWDHQYEWRKDLTYDFDKLHEYGVWVIKSWNNLNIKPLTEEYKDKINWSKRYIDTMPKLRPWQGNLEKQTYTNQNANRDLEIIEEAILKINGDESRIEKLKDIKENIFKFKAHFRDLSS